MKRKEKLRIFLVTALFFLALGGWLLHIRIHPITKSSDFIIPLVSGTISVFILPILFWLDATVTLAYIANGLITILGTILMAHFSIISFNGPLTIQTIALNTTFPDIVILWGKFLVGKAIFDLRYLRSDQDEALKGRFIRYPNMGWWLVHLAAISLVYAVGNIFWK